MEDDTWNDPHIIKLQLGTTYVLLWTTRLCMYKVARNLNAVYKSYTIC